MASRKKSRLADRTYFVALGTYAYALVYQEHGQTKEGDHESDNHGEGETQIYIRHPKEAIAEGVHHINDGIDLRYRLPDLRQQTQAIEDAPQIGQWGQDKGGNDGYIVEGIGEYGIDQSRQRKHHGGHQDG